MAMAMAVAPLSSFASSSASGGSSSARLRQQRLHNRPVHLAPSIGCLVSRERERKEVITGVSLGLKVQESCSVAERRDSMELAERRDSMERSGRFQVRRRPSKVRLGRVNGGISDLYTPSSPVRLAASSTNNLHKSRVVRVSASVEDGVQSPEAPASSGEGRTSTSTTDPPTSESPSPSPSNPFAGGKISRIAAKQQSGNGDSKQSMSASVAQKAATPKKPKTPAPGQLSANAAAQLKVSRQPSVFKVPTKPTDELPSSPFSQPGPSPQKPSSPFAPAGQKKPTAPVNPFRKEPLVPADWEKAGAWPAGSGKRVLDAFKEGDKISKLTTKFGQPVVPTNIFDEVRRTPEEIAADAFKFEINPGQLLLAGSFIVVIAIMFGTVFLVWKVGAIHYNEL